MITQFLNSVFLDPVIYNSSEKCPKKYLSGISLVFREADNNSSHLSSAHCIPGTVRRANTNSFILHKLLRQVLLVFHFLYEEMEIREVKQSTHGKQDGK